MHRGRRVELPNKMASKIKSFGKSDSSVISKGGQTKGRIIDAAIKLFAKQGYHGTSFQLVADYCQIHQPAIFYYFDSKEALLREVIAEVIRRSHEVVTKQTEGQVVGSYWLIGHFIGNLEWVKTKKEEASVLLLLYYLATQERMFQKDYLNLQQLARKRILVILQHSHAQNLLQGDLDINVISSYLHDLLLGGLVNYLATGAEKSEEQNLVKKWRWALSQIYLELPKKWHKL